jgi:hypothetical protein
LQRLVLRAQDDDEIAGNLRGRTDIDWATLRTEIDTVSGKILDSLGEPQQSVDPVLAGKVNAVVYNRIRNRAGFSSKDWKLAVNQVKALSDRKQLDERALARFARFGYGHHIAAALTLKLGVQPEVFVKWLATQDYVAVTVAVRALGIAPELFQGLVTNLPWRDLPTEDDIVNVRRRYEALGREEASGIFELWRAHAFRRRQPVQEVASSVA